MKRPATLPLGIDIGSARTRVALSELDAAGRPRLVAVAARPTGDDPARAIAQALDELATRERRCVLALGAPASVLRTVAFPPLQRRERERAARFEASRLTGHGSTSATIRVVPIDRTRCVIGVAQRDAIEARTAAVRRAGLRTVAVDDAGLALLRAFPYSEAIVDVGAAATTLIVRDEPIPLSRTFGAGGLALTAAAADALGIEPSLAEQRKRSIGLAGAGEQVCENLIDQLASAIVDVRAAVRTEIRAIALVGNGSRLPGFAERLERAVAIPVRAASLTPDTSTDLPADVVRAASVDWGLAFGLALWAATA